MEKYLGYGRVALGGMGVACAYLFGGWNVMLELLVWMIAGDYVTGIMAAGFSGGTISSKIGFKRLPKKVIIFVLVMIGHFIDRALQLQNDMVMNSIGYFYIANEFISITENAGRAGLPLPDIVTKMIEVLKAKGGASSNDDQNNSAGH